MVVDRPGLGRRRAGRTRVASASTPPVRPRRHCSTPPPGRAMTVGPTAPSADADRQRPAWSTTSARRDRDDHGVAHADLQELLPARRAPAPRPPRRARRARAPCASRPTMNSCDGMTRVPPGRAPPRSRRRAPTAPESVARRRARAEVAADACRRCGSGASRRCGPPGPGPAEGRRARAACSSRVGEAGAEPDRVALDRASRRSSATRPSATTSSGRRWPKLTSTMKSVRPRQHVRARTVRERREGVVDRHRSEQGHRGILVGPGGPFAHWVLFSPSTRHSSP